MTHENSDQGVLCKTPLGYREGQALARLMTLKNFVDGGYDVIDGRMLLCVKSVGARKKSNSSFPILTSSPPCPTFCANAMR